MTLGSLFSGSGGFELAGVLNGISPVWASEIEPYPIAVTTSRFPCMKHLGNVAKINGAEIEPVDVITFGSPCFPSGVLILTDRGFLPIEEVTVGMKVLSHTGAWRTVTAVGSKLAETILLKGNHYGLETTPNHPIYSAELEQDGKNLQHMGEWTAAEDMDGKYWAVPNEVQQIPIPPVLYEAREKKNLFALNEDSFYLIGRWLGDGWLRNSQRPGRPPGQKWGVILICESYDKAEE